MTTSAPETFERYSEAWKELFHFRQQAAYWQSLADRRADKIEELEAVNKELIARLKNLEARVYGSSSEKSKPSDNDTSTKPPRKRKRGQRKGSKGHGRKPREQLATTDAHHDLDDDEKLCGSCGTPYRPNGQETSHTIDVQVRVTRKRNLRQRYQRACECSDAPASKVADGPLLLFPKGLFTTRSWVYFLTEKFLFGRPLNRVLTQLKAYGLKVSAGTITGGFEKIGPMLLPLYEALIERSQQADHWHADETGWRVFGQDDGRGSDRWWLWVFSCKDSVVFYCDPSRSRSVPAAHFGLEYDPKVAGTKGVAGSSTGVISADRYLVYRSLDGFVVAFCWAHVRRDFLEVGRGHSELQEWAQEWVERIGGLYKLNERRLKFEADTPEGRGAQRELEKGVEAFAAEAARQLGEEQLAVAQEKVLESLCEHWEGLVLFVWNREIPMDNNLSERLVRCGAMARKVYWGSGSEWSSQLLCRLLSVQETAKRWGLNPVRYLEDYLESCARNGGEAPEDLSRWLPWEQSEEERAELCEAIDSS